MLEGLRPGHPFGYFYLFYRMLLTGMCGRNPERRERNEENNNYHSVLRFDSQVELYVTERLHVFVDVKPLQIFRYFHMF